MSFGMRIFLRITMWVYLGLSILLFRVLTGFGHSMAGMSAGVGPPRYPIKEALPYVCFGILALAVIPKIPAFWAKTLFRFAWICLVLIILGEGFQRWQWTHEIGDAIGESLGTALILGVWSLIPFLISRSYLPTKCL